MTPSAFDYEYIGKDGDWYCFQERGYGAPDSEKMKDFKKDIRSWDVFFSFIGVNDSSF